MLLKKATQLPTASELNGQLTICDLCIDDLFERNTGFQLDEMQDKFKDQQVLVTGGAGSIGSELCKTLAYCNPKKLVIADQNEARLWALKQSLSTIDSIDNIRFELLDITNQDALSYLFEKNQFTIVIHAAAYKQLPLLQENLYAACTTNFLATVSLAKLAQQHSVGTFLNVSTDKAVMPISYLGLTKRAAEVYLTHLNDQSINQTQFCNVRLGNVIGSIGSVVPMFIRQLENNIPLTITHLNAERYFIANKSVSQLLLEALWIDVKADTLVFSMMQNIKITALASVVKMLYLKTLSNDSDKGIQIIGLRSGEKLKEVLHYPDAQVTDTNNQNICIVKETALHTPKIDGIVSKLVAINHPSNTTQIEELLLNLVS